jgi:urease accessory protein
MRAGGDFADGAAVFFVLTLTASKIARAGAWLPDAAIDEITLDYDSRHRRRFRLTAASGTEIMLHLTETTHIRGGDALVLDEGGFVAVHAAPEQLLEVTAADADALTRLAWHLGNRHLAVQILPGRLRLLDDHVIAEMLPSLGGTVARLTAPFDPESGAYQHG